MERLEQPKRDGADGAVLIDVIADSTASFCMQQNYVDLVKAVTITNGTGAPLRDVAIRVTSEPGFVVPSQVRVAGVAAGSRYRFDRFKVELSPDFLVGLSERTRGLLHVVASDASGERARACVEVEVLAYDQWGGINSLPELLGAFVLPNHPTTEMILGGAAQILRASQRNDALDGYQRETRAAVIEMSGAIYEAIRRQGIGYVNPPASFELAGQKVRTPDRILSNKLGTCLDLSVLVAACLEQAGLHPLIFLTQEHAFAGVWLDDRTFGTATLDDPVEVRKRIDNDEMVAIETTLLAGSASLPFDKAALQGRRHLDSQHAFFCAVDIRRARKAQIRPIQGRVSEAGVFVPVVTEVPQAAVADGPMPALPGVREAFTMEELLAVEETRLDRWRRKLLDLTLNNRLLNYRPTKKTLPILCADLAEFEDSLAGGRQFGLFARPAELGAAGIRDAEAFRAKTGDDGLKEVLREAVRGNRLHFDLDEPALELRLIEMYRAARLAVEESGTSTLYCALGFLTWFASSTSEQPRLAPLLLVPVNLTRKSAKHGFRLELGDDEPRVNVSLLAMLEQDFDLQIAGLDPLPRDEHGVDVARVFEKLRHAVQDVKRWEVQETAQVGFFSFSKFLMWRDLQEHAQDLLENEVVDHLVNHRNEAFAPGAPIAATDRLDEERPPDEVFTPLSADSSQLQAIFAAADGRSFVLEGPPGTGKSQTITNLIAQCLANGKTVLFVAEKNVALRVVHDRLDKIGLGDFCLELHSTKARKADVMGQLDRAMNRQRAASPQSWPRHASKLGELRAYLNAYVAALHDKRESGDSVFDGLSRLIHHCDAPEVRFAWPSPAEITAERLADFRELVQSLKTVGDAVANVPAHPWIGVQAREWTPLWQREVREQLECATGAAERLQRRATDVATLLGFAVDSWSWLELQGLAEAARCLLDPPAVSLQLVTAGDWPTMRAGISNLVALGLARDALREQVFPRFRNTVLGFDVTTLLAGVRSSARSWVLLRFLHRVFLRWKLRPVLASGAQLADAELEPALESAVNLQDIERRTRALGEQWASPLSHLWRDGEADWDAVAAAVEWVDRLRMTALAAAGDDPTIAATYRTAWAELLSAAPEAFRGEGKYATRLRALNETYGELAEALSQLETLLQLRDRLVPDGGMGRALSELGLRLRTMFSALPALKGWCQWQAVRARACAQGLAPLVQTYERGEVLSQQLEAAFERGYYQWWTDAVVSEQPTLSAFHSREHLRKIRDFQQLDDAHRELALQMVRSRLSGRAPQDTDSAPKDSAMGVLRRETRKRRGHKPVRALLGVVGDVVTRLTPCFLMSPSSVAQYLDPRMPKFDVVVFDEASQIPVWDAVGAIARGRSTVIVGDPKQLPPTSFFARSGDDDEADGDLEDLESILDDCIGAQLPWLRLRWHYRSRHESLIAFSNHHYYENGLFTFPSPDTAAATGTGVSLRFVDGAVYDKGKSRTNRKEAEELVASLVERLRDPTASHSVGIVTLNVQQRVLIEDLIEQARREDPELDQAFVEDGEESVFVKNLENVQGDERDIILFSIGYGPDSLGRVSMNFGPMNRDGGYRRLNVAVTRARCEVIVFSSLRSEQIDLSRTGARGVKELKAYLDFAERGVRAISEMSEHHADAEFDSPFEEQVYKRVTALGWQVHKQVGCSGYRIDLAVVDKQRPGRYLLGVECDGATYHSAATARDRDKLREEVLKGLGWTLHRIWSTDWWQDAAGETERLHQVLEDAQQAADRNAAAPTYSDAFDAASSTPVLVVAEPSDEARYGPRPSEDECQKEVSLPPVAEQRVGDESHDADVVAPASASNPLGRVYQLASLESVSGEPGQFYSVTSSRLIRDAMHEVVRAEGPISLMLLSRRVAARWALGRVTSRAVRHIEGLIDGQELRIADDGGVFVWPAILAPESYACFRYPQDPAGQRDADDLPLSEVANAAHEVLRNSIRLPAEELARETARLFGFQRTGTKVTARMRAGIQRLLDSERAEMRGTDVALND